MIRGVSIKNHSGEEYTYELGKPYDTGVCITDIAGLGPPKADLTVQSVYNMDGGRFSVARAQTRNVVLAMEMVGDNPPSARRLIYRAFPIKELVRMQFLTDSSVYEARGYVESVTPNIFSDKESVQVSVICPQPFLTEKNSFETGRGFFSVSGGFQFPFTNQIDKAELQFGDQQRSSSFTVNYPGEIVTGCRFELPMLETPGIVSIYNHSRGTVLQIDMDLYAAIDQKTITRGYTLEVDSRPDSFGARVKRPDGTIFQASGMVTTNSVWPKLQPGPNDLEIYTSKSRMVNVLDGAVVYYSPLYMGV